MRKAGKLRWDQTDGKSREELRRARQEGRSLNKTEEEHSESRVYKKKTNVGLSNRPGKKEEVKQTKGLTLSESYNELQ